MSHADHAYLAPSSADRIVECPGSAAMAALFPQEPTIDTREGEASHWAAAQMLIAGSTDAVAENTCAPNGVIVSGEILEGAEAYAEFVMARGPVGDVEVTIKNSDLHPENWGTPDHARFSTYPYKLNIDDYKFGHEFVEVYENYQLINYALLKMYDLAIDGHQDQHLQVDMTIYQPRSYHKDGPARTWSVKGSDLRGYRNRLRMQFELAMEPNAKLKVNPHCKHCPARFACPELQRAGYAAAQTAYSASPLIMSPQAMGLELKTLRRARDMLNARITGMEEQALTNIMRGGVVPYFAVEFGQARTVWKSDADEAGIIQLGEMMGYPIANKKAITPKQALKLGMNPDLVSEYSYTPNGAAKLVEDTGTKAAKIFKD